ncbi:MAG: hypothetical protein LBN24_05285 [Mediterranea sp.]|jgi:hypothetical protein|nr:hypothetical protein [Mediterranea sp.]
MKRPLLSLLCLAIAANSFAQKKGFTYHFYGQVRADYYYNSRANEELVDGLFYLYPKDRDRNGVIPGYLAGGNYELSKDDERDMNSTPNSNFYSIYSQLGVDLTGPNLGSARTSAKVEIDFRGSGSSFTLARIRHAYFKLNWTTSELLVGQAWHPLFGDVSPKVLNLSVGAPYQPFSRAPQIRYRYEGAWMQLTAALVWQSQYLSQGPKGRSNEYIKHSNIPEVYLGADYKQDGLLAGVGVELLSLKPRTVASQTFNGMGFGGYYSYTTNHKVNERITTLSYEAHLRYTHKDWMVAAKSVLGSNLTQACGLGGYGIKEINQEKDEQKYTPLRFSSSWLNVVYGRKWKPGLFVGYAKNLGTPDPLASTTLYGTGTNLDQLVSVGAELTYNLPHWKLGVEYTLCKARYGSLDQESGKSNVDKHSVQNHRVVAAAIFLF